MLTLSSKELELGGRVLGVDQTSRVNLDLVHINAVGTNLHQHLLTITSGVSTVGAGQAEGVRAVLLEERRVAEVSSIATGSQNNDAIRGDRLSILLVGHTGDVVSIPVDGGDAGSLLDLNTVRLELAELFQALHEGVGDGHSRELGIMATVCSGLRVTTIEPLAFFRHVASEFESRTQDERQESGRG